MNWRCLLRGHTRPVTIFGMVESSPDRGMRELGGFRCACGALVFRKYGDWRKGQGAKRAIKRAAAVKR